MNDDLSPLKSFRAFIAPWESIYIDALFCFQGIEAPNRINLLQARVFLQRESITDVKPAVRFAGQAVGQISLKQAGVSVWDLLTRLQSGKSITIGGVEFVLPLEGGGSPTGIFRMRHEESPIGTRVCHFSFSGGNVSRLYSHADLDWSLKANNPPYDQVGELLFEYGLRNDTPDFAYVEVYAGPAAEINFTGCGMAPTAKVSILTSPKLDRSLVSLGVIVHNEGKVVGRSFHCDTQISWRDPELAEVRMPVIGEAALQAPQNSVLKCFLNVAGVTHHEGWIADPIILQNWRRTSYEWADNGLAILRQFLFEEGKPRREARDFEFGVSCLLWMLGFGTLQLSNKRLEDNPDILVTTPQGRFALVECTTDVIDRDDKLAKLHARTRALFPLLGKSAISPIQCLPVMVTALRASEVMDVEKATQFGIRVLTRDDLREMLDRAVFPHDADILFQEQFQALANLKDGYARRS